MTTKIKTMYRSGAGAVGRLSAVHAPTSPASASTTSHSNPANQTVPERFTSRPRSKFYNSHRDLASELGHLTVSRRNHSKNSRMKQSYILLVCAAALLSTGCRQSPAQNEGREGKAALVLDSKAALGREVFLQHSRPPCSQCHILREAGARARIGSNLDDLKPDIERVRRSVTDGSGLMPPQADRLTVEQIEAVAYYVATVAGKTD